jgi:hypothetical protein
MRRVVVLWARGSPAGVRLPTEYLKDKLISLKQIKTKIPDSCGSINEFKKGYEPRTDLIKEKSGDFLADSGVI